jgi:hypothetical protein
MKALQTPILGHPRYRACSNEDEYQLGIDYLMSEEAPLREQR